MGIFVPGKDGDAMGGYAYQRMGKKQRQAFAIQKQAEEEHMEAETLADPKNYYARARVRKKFDDKIKKDRKAAGLD